MSKTVNKDFNYLKAKKELDDIMQSLKEEDIPLDLVIELYKKALKLTSDMENYLEETKNSITQIKAQFHSE